MPSDRRCRELLQTHSHSPTWLLFALSSFLPQLLEFVVLFHVSFIGESPNDWKCLSLECQNINDSIESPCDVPDWEQEVDFYWVPRSHRTSYILDFNLTLLDYVPKKSLTASRVKTAAPKKRAGCLTYFIAHLSFPSFGTSIIMGVTKTCDAVCRADTYEKCDTDRGVTD
eukprot:sb/3472219/